jgi:hypothetical protein
LIDVSGGQKIRLLAAGRLLKRLFTHLLSTMSLPAGAAKPIEVLDE